MSHYFKIKEDDSTVWRAHEITSLIGNVKAGATLPAISRIHRRSQECIKAKLNHMAADYYFTDHATFRLIQDLTGITENDFLVKRIQSQPKISITVTDADTDTIEPISVSPKNTLKIANPEEIKTDICTNLAFAILDTVIGGSLILRSTITNIQNIHMESDV
jgi:hypothetical protein